MRCIVLPAMSFVIIEPKYAINRMTCKCARSFPTTHRMWWRHFVRPLSGGRCGAFPDRPGSFACEGVFRDAKHFFGRVRVWSTGLCSIRVRCGRPKLLRLFGGVRWSVWSSRAQIRRGECDSRCGHGSCEILDRATRLFFDRFEKGRTLPMPSWDDIPDALWVVMGPFMDVLWNETEQEV